ncbi:MAG: hypothetical protein EB830_04895 [Nitrosopumilus sp. H13]|nr:MAG: hypothetical protein EB830_04895 [Nitrosopumilus sp. H13]
MNEKHTTIPILPAPVVSPTKTLGIQRIVPVMLILLSVSLVVLFAPPTSAYEDAIKAPDLTDYVSMYKKTYKNILDNEKSIKDDKKILEDKLELSKTETTSIKKRISDKVFENKRLWEKVDEFERLNIESYKLDKKTQKLFDESENVIRNNFLDVNGVYDVFIEKKYRKVVVFVDPDNFANSNYAHGIGSFIDEIQKSVGVDVEVLVTKSIQTHSVGCSTPTNPCQPAKGGIQISHQNTAGGGSTLGFKAQHKTHGTGFIIAGHEAVSVNTNIVQPINGGVIGVVKAMGGALCDCAFVKSTGSHSMNDEVWASTVGTIYPVGVRNVAPTPTGTFVMYLFNGAGNSAKLGQVVHEDGNHGLVSVVPEGGDSGAALIKPRIDGKADIYGILTGGVGPYAIYEPYDYIKSDLGLLW